MMPTPPEIEPKPTARYSIKATIKPQLSLKARTSLSSDSQSGGVNIHAKIRGHGLASVRNLPIGAPDIRAL